MLALTQKNKFVQASFISSLDVFGPGTQYQALIVTDIIQRRKAQAPKRLNLNNGIFSTITALRPC
jgi:hypothetical protein